MTKLNTLFLCLLSISITLNGVAYYDRISEFPVMYSEAHEAFMELPVNKPSKKG